MSSAQQTSSSPSRKATCVRHSPYGAPWSSSGCRWLLRPPRLLPAYSLLVSFSLCRHAARGMARRRPTPPQPGKRTVVVVQPVKRERFQVVTSASSDSSYRVIVQPPTVILPSDFVVTTADNEIQNLKRALDEERAKNRALRQQLLELDGYHN